MIYIFKYVQQRNIFINRIIRTQQHNIMLIRVYIYIQVSNCIIYANKLKNLKSKANICTHFNIQPM